MAKVETRKWLVQSWSDICRPGSAEDGPPYADPGMWITIAGADTKAEADAMFERVENRQMGYTPFKRRVIENKPVTTKKARPRKAKQLVAA